MKLVEIKMNTKKIAKLCHEKLAPEDFDILERTLMDMKDVKRIVEIGSMYGCSSVLFGLLAKKLNAQVYCIEKEVRLELIKNIEDYDVQDVVEIIEEETPWSGYAPGVIDYLFIDGEHRTRWVLADYHFFSKFVRSGGRIAFHDWNKNTQVAKWVKRAVDIILEDDKLIKVEETDIPDRGVIVFEKP